jgi:hypothetical protein
MIKEAGGGLGEGHQPLPQVCVFSDHFLVKSIFSSKKHIFKVPSDSLNKKFNLA